MKIIKNILKLTSITTAILAPQLVNAQATSPMEVSATVIPGCFIEADNINFGTLAMPLADQSAQSDVRIKCSKNTSLKIAIDYSNNGNVNSGFNIEGNLGIVIQSTTGYYQTANFTINGEIISKNMHDISCFSEAGSNFRLRLYTVFAHELLGVENNNTNDFTKDIEDVWGFCNNTKVNLEAVNSLSNVGKLSGIISGEQINYYLELPNNNSQWNNINTLNFNTTGLEQTFPMKANIKRADNPTHRMTPDTYQSTLTVVLTY